MNYLPGIFSLLVAVCGWYYLFYSRAAMKLSAVENPTANRIRVTLRRAGGLTMLLLAATFYAGTVALEKQNAPSAAAFIFIAACLMFIVVALALIDLRMTNMLRKSQRNQKINPEARMRYGLTLRRNFIQCTIVAAILAVFLSITGCDGPPASAPTSSPSAGQPQSLPTVNMALGKSQFTIEVAAEEGTRMKGLMDRPSMPADHGMIFAFVKEEPQAFWMKNTLIPLDIVYIDAAGTIVSIRQMKPMDLTSIESGKPVKYAIELNLGVATAAGLKVGDTIKVPQSVTDSAK